jgi:outer membrane immunogenic protein
VKPLAQAGQFVPKELFMRTVIFAATAATAIAAAAFATPAFAQDDSKSFSGPRVEAIAGWDHFNDGSNGQRISNDGVTYGGAAGYDFQAGKLVFGAEGEVTGSTVRDRAGDVLVAGDSLRTKMGRDLYVGGRIGFVAAPQVMIYGKAGYTNARIETDYTTPTTTTRDHADADGYRLGAGVEFNLSRNVFLNGEYRYSNYKKLEGYDIDLDRHQVVGGVGFRF